MHKRMTDSTNMRARCSSTKCSQNHNLIAIIAATATAVSTKFDLNARNG
jgi:hypothetical protein